MEDVATAPPPSAPMTGIVEPSTNGLEPAAQAPTATPPAEAENACETLYIQNLNEKIKTDGHSPFFLAYTSTEFVWL